MKDYDFSTKEGTIRAIRNEAIEQGFGLTTQVAYILATVEWETAGTFQPIAEYGGPNKRYAPYYGRGYVQLTWVDNYRAYSEKLGLNLVSNPDLAMEPENALFILLDGFKTGAFTGKKLTDYINDQDTDYYNARRCINGTDRAEEIAALAEKWQEEVENS